MSYHKISPSEQDLRNINEKLDKILSDSDKESRRNAKRFGVNLFFAVVAALAAVVSAVVCIAPFVS